MKRIIIMAITLVVILLAIGCSNNLTNPALVGFYQSEMKNGYHVQFSFHEEDKTFIGYINNIEINQGTYEALGDGKYKLSGDKQDLEIKLEADNTFNLNMEKLSENINEKEPIIMENESKTPAYFKTEFSEEYKKAIEKLLE